MLKLPKGLKKKKKGKKSKKNQELFTEEELETYKREQREKQLAEEGQLEKTADDEWSKFNALTTGIDTVLKKTQGDLDRIKESSFFQRVPTASQQKATKKLEEEQHIAQNEESCSGVSKAEVSEDTKDHLAQAVIELSDSGEESEEADDIFDTNYIDVITSGDVQLAYVPESPEEELDLGPDPFDTTYADKVIKGPEVSKRGKKLVNIGSAVEVLTGRVEKFTAVSTSRRPRRGPQNLLLESFDNDSATDGQQTDPDQFVVAAPVKTLLDDFADECSDVPIDLSVSLHIAFQKEKDEQKELESLDVQKNVLSEFDVLEQKQSEEDDEFAELAAESLTKRDEIHTFTKVEPTEVLASAEETGHWAAFEEQTKEVKAKPSRPPPPRPATGPNIQKQVEIKPIELQQEEKDEFELDLPEDDPFDTTFVEKVIPVTEDDDFDFDPRADEKREQNTASLVINQPLKKPVDLLGGSSTDLSELAHIPIISQESFSTKEVEIDPFDTSAVSFIVQPKETEIKFLEKELLGNTTLKHSLSDPDFDPRADEAELTKEAQIKLAYENTARRKSSLSLNIGSGAPKTVGFTVVADLLGVNNAAGNGKIQKPLTPYYNQVLSEESELDDPFDTSLVPENNLSKTEINLLEQDLLKGSSLKRDLSDPDFDPRAVTPVAPPVKSCLLGVNETEHNIKVLTPAIDQDLSFDSQLSYASDPFDTSAVTTNILPGQAELKLLEKELLPTITGAHNTVLDSYSDSQELGLGDKVLTPYLDTTEEVEIDPFDTSFASNLAPGKTEIQLLESELIN